jgi:hypothetical protein
VDPPGTFFAPGLPPLFFDPLDEFLVFLPPPKKPIVQIHLLLACKNINIFKRASFTLLFSITVAKDKESNECRS